MHAHVFIQEGSSMKDEYLLWADGIILVYSMIDKMSFDKLREIADWILTKKGEEKVSFFEKS